MATAATITVTVLTLAAAGAAALLDALVDPAHRAALDLSPGWAGTVPGVALVLSAALILRRMPRHPVAWVMVVGGVLWTEDGVSSAWLAFATQHDPVLRGASLTFWLVARLGAFLVLSLPLLLVLYPDGRFPTGRWRVAALVSLGTTLLMPLAVLTVPSQVAQAVAGEPLPELVRHLNLDPTTLTALPAAAWQVVLRVALVMGPLGMLVPFAIVVRRFRQATGDDRLRMRWLVWAGLVDVLVILSIPLLTESQVDIGLPLIVTVTAIAVAVGVLRPKLGDIGRLLRGTLRYGALAVSVVLVDLVVIAGVTAVLGERLAERDVALLSLGLVMAVYGALRLRLWLLVHRFLFRRQNDPYGVVAGLAEQLERSEEPQQQLMAVARTIAEAFRSSYVGVEVDRLDGTQQVAEHGERPAATQALPISYRGEPVGRVVFGRARGLARGGSRAPGGLAAEDERLLGDVVRQAAAAARTTHLAAQLQSSREELVAAREEERRRLRRDLHDGLGPSLGAVAMRIDTARNLDRIDPEQADRLLRQAREEVAAVLADVRRLVHGLRPPALDDVGLLAAIRQQAERQRVASTAIRVESTPELNGLPAAVEVAAYRIATEALTNVARHARATNCRVRLEPQDTHLLVEITDDGTGIAEGTPTGIGLISLRERAAELGGRCEIISAVTGGTTVRAWLPVGARRAAGVGND
jgi:signal transduction histidine kinase